MNETSVDNATYIKSLLEDAKIAYEVVEEPVYRFNAWGFYDWTYAIYPYINRYDANGYDTFLIIFHDSKAQLMTAENMISYMLYQGVKFSDGRHHIYDPSMNIEVGLCNCLVCDNSILAVEDLIPLFESGEIYKLKGIGKVRCEQLYNNLIELGFKFNAKPINKQAEKDAMIFKSINELAEKLDKPVEEVRAILKECNIIVVKRKKKEGE